MPGLDPSIPLGVAPLAPPQQQNPMAMIGQWAQIQNSLNQNKLFQQTFAARQKAGALLAAAPDMESGLAALMRDPTTAPFAGETINAIRQSQLTLTQLQGEVQTQAKTGLEGFAKMLPTVFADPSEETWNNMANATLETLSPQAKARVAPAIGSLKKALMDGLPDDPASRKATFTQRLTGMMLSSGVTPDAIKQLVGTNEFRDLGGRLQPTLKRPEQLGGGESAIGPAFSKSLPPTVVTQPGGIPDVLGGGGGNPLVPRPSASLAPGGNPLSPGAGTGGAGLTERKAAGQAPLYETPAVAGEEVAFDGKPLIPPGSIEPTAKVSRSVGGMNVLAPAQQKAAEKLMENFQGEELNAYQNNVASLGSLDRMDHALEAMAKTGGIIQPGAFGAARLEMAKTLNLLGDLFHVWDSSKPVSDSNKPPVDANSIADAEALRKEATRAGMLFLSQTLGAQREAASVIQSTIQAVPGLDNTLLGGRLVSRALRASAQRAIDQRKFQEAWASSNQGDLSGSVTAFNKVHPGRDYFETVLKSMGMDEGGFQTPQDIQRAFSNGYLTKGEATGFLHQQFPDLFKAPGKAK